MFWLWKQSDTPPILPMEVAEIFSSFLGRGKKIRVELSRLPWKPQIWALACCVNAALDWTWTHTAALLDFFELNLTGTILHWMDSLK